MIGPGDRIGDYRVIREVGEGGMAWVYQVVGIDDHPNLTFRGRSFALKLMKPEVASTEHLVKRFEREAELQVDIEHPSLLTIFDYGRDAAHGLFYFTMNYVEGINLAEKTKRDGALSLPRVREVYSHVLGALAKLHEHAPPVVHRDIKPANILLAADGHVFLSDLGVARLGDGSGHTRTKALLGTAQFSSPEQARGRAVDARSDLYSLGLSLFHSLTGHSIYEDIEDVDTDAELDVLGYLGHLERVREELELRMPEAVPEPIAEVIRRAGRIRPEERYQSAREMRRALLEALNRAESGIHVSAPGAGSEAAPASFRRPSRRPTVSPRRAAGAGLGLLLLVAALSLVLWVRSDTGPSVSERGPLPLGGALRALSEESERALLRGASFEDAPWLDAAVRLSEKRTRAADFMAAAGLAHAQGNDPFADTAVARARALYDETCSELSNAGLAERAATTTATLRARVERLRGVAAPTWVADHWGELARRMGALPPSQPSAAPCTAAHHQLDQLEAVAVAQGALARVEQELEPLLPEIASAAATRAQARADAAAEASVEAVPFREARARGEALASEAAALAASGEFLTATERSAEAEHAFDEAMRVVPAATTRTAAHSAFEQASDRQLADPSLEADLARAERLYAAGGFDEAALLYTSVAERVAGTLADAQQSQTARQTAIAAEAARELALTAWAPEAAPELFERADALREQGSQALAEQHYTIARSQYQKALTAYEGANGIAGRERKRAEEALAGATKAASRWGTGAERCADSPDPVRGSCEGAFAALGQGNAAFAAGRPLEATVLFERASNRFLRARRQRREISEGLPPSPVIREREPARPTLYLRRGQSIALSVDASAGSGELDYLWLVDDEPQANNDARFEWTFETPVSVIVRVDDGDARTEPATASWQLAARNTRPELTLSPTTEGGRVLLKEGEHLDFRASAIDPDGDPVQIEFVVGDRLVRGESFRFEAREPGMHRVRVSASDGNGETVLTRQIEVRKKRWWQR